VTQALGLADRTRQIQPQLVAWRRDFHQHPELAFQENRSAAQITQVLESLNYVPRTGIAQTGLIAHIEGRQASPHVLIRFDMDALPIQEETGATYSSKIDGVMHACGHDGHMAIGLGVAKVLRQIQDELPGSVVLLFQPAEEGEGGAQRMIEEGVLKEAYADYALGLHIWNEKPLGWVGITPGACMAGADSFRIRLTGKGGHGAQPHLTHDPILTAAHLITALQSIVSRRVDPIEPAVLSVTKIEGGDAYNVIPAQVELRGTLRTFSIATRSMILEELHRIAEREAEGFHCQATIEILEITPPLVNQESIARSLSERFRRLKPDWVIDETHRVMGSEDMAYFLAQIPGCYIFLGSANDERGLNAAHHNSTFDFDESVLSRGVYVCVQAALALMEAG
jgi:amidohydrolase